MFWNIFFDVSTFRSCVCVKWALLIRSIFSKMVRWIIGTPISILVRVRVVAPATLPSFIHFCCHQWSNQCSTTTYCIQAKKIKGKKKIICKHGKDEGNVRRFVAALQRNRHRMKKKLIGWNRISCSPALLINTKSNRKTGFLVAVDSTSQQRIYNLYIDYVRYNREYNICDKNVATAGAYESCVCRVSWS